jgi:hypothetical protein
MLKKLILILGLMAGLASTSYAACTDLIAGQHTKAGEVCGPKSAWPAE